MSAKSDDQVAPDQKWNQLRKNIWKAQYFPVSLYVARDEPNAIWIVSVFGTSGHRTVRCAGSIEIAKGICLDLARGVMRAAAERMAEVESI